MLPIKLPDKPGELAKIARKLANARINVECIYILGREKGTTEIALKVDKLEEARKTLKPHLSK